MSKLRKFDGKSYSSANWFYQKLAAQGSAKWHRDRGMSARIVRARGPGAGNRMGYELFLRGKGK